MLTVNFLNKQLVILLKAVSLNSCINRLVTTYVFSLIDGREKLPNYTKATAGITAVPDHAAASGATAAVTPPVPVPANKGRLLIYLFTI